MVYAGIKEISIIFPFGSTGETISIKVLREKDNAWLDSDDGTFKALANVTTALSPLTEISGGEGIYTLEESRVNWENDVYLIFAFIGNILVGFGTFDAYYRHGIVKPLNVVTGLIPREYSNTIINQDDTYITIMEIDMRNVHTIGFALKNTGSNTLTYSISVLKTYTGVIEETLWTDNLTGSSIITKDLINKYAKLLVKVKSPNSSDLISASVEASYQNLG